ncbi:MAG: CBS domain-containing protein [Thiogranum sp.]|nr:CBS domain-containing protein [Thiogranum sp.]
MTASSVMDPNPTVLRPTDTIGTAAEYIMEHRCRRLPVVAADGRYQGVFGVDCLLRMVLPKAIVMEHGLEKAPFIRETLSDLHRRFLEVEKQPVSLCMGEEAETVAPDTPLIETLRILYHHRGSLPVVDPESGRLMGMISYWDVGAAILAAQV